LTENEKESAPNVMLQNLRALHHLKRREFSQAESVLEECIEMLRGPMVGMTSDEYIDLGGILVDLAHAKSDIKDKESNLKRALMMTSKAYRINVHLHAGVQANLCEFYRRAQREDESCSLADQLLLSLNSSFGGNDLSTKSRWGGDGEHGENYDFLWSDLCLSDMRSAQFYFTVARSCGNFRSASEALLHFNNGFRALSVHVEAFSTTRIHGVPELKSVGGSLAHAVPTFVEGCIDLATVKGVSKDSKIIFVDKADYLTLLCSKIAPTFAGSIGMDSSSEELLTLVRHLIDGKECDMSDGAVKHLSDSYNAAKACMGEDKNVKKKNKLSLDVGDRHIVGLALLDARFHLT
jgi:hypothetical protein